MLYFLSSIHNFTISF